MVALLLLPIAFQAVVMIIDEGWCHRRRGLPRWERIGHPLDTLTIAACLVWLVLVPASAHATWIYGALAAFSTLFVTKDEAVHARLCSGVEHWLHALLFVLHPMVLAAFAVLWWQGETRIIAVQLGVTLAFGLYQVIYWNVVRDRASSPINNAWYAELGSRWYNAEDTPIALLRAEARQRNPWIASELVRGFGDRPLRVLDLGCGAGFLANDLARRGHIVTGIDMTPENLEVARQRDGSGRADYRLGDACALPFADASFDVVCAMDLLEHVDDPGRVIAEVSRVLAPSGAFFFHTFNRTWQSKLIVIKGVEWFVANTPKDLHVFHMFVTPDELAAMCTRERLEITALHGSRPRFRWPLWRMLFTGRVGDDFAFTFTPSTKLGYTGYARKAAAT